MPSRLTPSLWCLSAALVLHGCTNPAGSGSSTTTSATFGSEVPNYPATGTVTTNIDNDVPAWIRDNFKNIRAYRDGSKVVIQTRGLPPYKTYYYSASGTYSTYHDAATKPDHVNPNVVVEQAITMTVPANPTLGTDLEATKTEAGLGIIGIAVNGVPIFNNKANPPDLIVNEVPSMDKTRTSEPRRSGHPTGGGIYHYHIQPAALTPESGAANELLGIAIDGFPIFGPKDKNGTIVFNAGGDEGSATTGWDLGTRNWVGASTDNTTISTGLPHYHVVYNYYQATTEAVGTIPAGTILADFYMIGTYIAGTKGTVTNAVSQR